MEWFGGSVTDAIAAARTSNKLLSILVYGDDSQSEQLSSSLGSDSLAPLVPQLVSLKLKKPSQELSQFSAVYPVLYVPSLYLIEAQTGVALEVLVGVQQAESLVEKINAVLQSRTTISNNDQVNMPETAPEEDLRESSPMDTAVPTVSSETAVESPQPSNSSEVDIQDKVERAEKLLELVRQDKAKKEQEEERRKEIERREAMKNIQRIKREQQDRELLEYAQKMQKERDEDRRYREKLEEEIKQERLRRNEKFTAEKAEAEEKRKKLLQEKQEEAERMKALNSVSANIMYRLPDGSSIRHLFDADAPFIEVRQYIADVKNLTDFNLALQFPRRVFDDNSDRETLRSLQLAPNAVILVISRTLENANPGTSDPGRSWWEMILTPFNVVLGFLSTFVLTIFPQSAVTAPPNGGPDERQAPGPSRNRGQDRSKKTPYQRTGNVHRLNTSDESDNENNTWNGNSTQQM